MVHDVDIDPGDDGDLPIGDIGAAAVAVAGAACLSCGAAIVGPFCATCGQRNDDLRRSSLVLFWDFLADTFAFDSRMWRTLGLMAAAPGLVPSNYSHGKRSRYTPPVRLFLVVSFLFFLALGLTQTLFIAVEVSKKSPEQIAAEKQRVEAAVDRAGDALSDQDLVQIDNASKLDCEINVKTRFFVRPKDLHIDPEAWRRCSEALRSAAAVEIVPDENSTDPSTTKKAKEIFERVLAGIGTAVEDPAQFNADVNNWLARVMFFMTPVLAVLLALFIRGKDALLFDHLVLALYSHAVAFAIVGAAIVAAQLGVKHTGPVAAVALAVYFLAALRRAYRRGWIKTVFTTIFVSLFYVIVLSSVVGIILINVVLN
jgi:hypothetical protein